MADQKDFIQTADWKREKHVPVIEIPARIKPGEFFPVKVTIGKEVAHPHKTEHHISKIDVYFLPLGEKFAVPIGSAQFWAHGASTQGPDTSTVYAHHEATLIMKTGKPGTLFAASECNIHGLWLNSLELEIEAEKAAPPALRA